VRQGDPTRRPVQIGVLNAAKIVRLRSEPSCASPCCTARSSSPTVSPSCGRAGALGSPLPERVTGIDLFQSLLELADRDQRSVYLLGARPEVVARVRSVVGERYPGARLVGSRDGYFNEDEAEQVAASITESGRTCSSSEWCPRRRRYSSAPTAPPSASRSSTESGGRSSAGRDHPACPAGLAARRHGVGVSTQAGAPATGSPLPHHQYRLPRTDGAGADATHCTVYRASGDLRRVS